MNAKEYIAQILKENFFAKSNMGFGLLLDRFGFAGE